MAGVVGPRAVGAVWMHEHRERAVLVREPRKDLVPAVHIAKLCKVRLPHWRWVRPNAPVVHSIKPHPREFAHHPLPQSESQLTAGVVVEVNVHIKGITLSERERVHRPTCRNPHGLPTAAKVGTSNPRTVGAAHGPIEARREGVARWWQRPAHPIVGSDGRDQKRGTPVTVAGVTLRRSAALVVADFDCKIYP